MVVRLRHETHAVTQPDARGLARDRAVKDLGIRAVRELLKKVMLHRPHGVPSAALAENCLFEGLLVRAMLTLATPRARHRNFVEQGKFHRHERSSPAVLGKCYPPRPLTMYFCTKARTAAGSSRSTTADGMTAMESSVRTIHSAASRRSRPGRTSPRAAASSRNGSQKVTQRSTRPPTRAVRIVARSVSCSAGS